jgi:hypothetical protein
MLAAVPALAQAQGGLFGPGVEIGANVAVGMPEVGGDGNDASLMAGPRVTLHLSSRNSLAFFADLAASKEEFGQAWTRSRTAGVNFRRVLYETGGFSVGAVAGTGLTRREIFTAEQVLPGPGGPQILPAGVRSSITPAFTFGLGLDQRLGDRLSVQGDVLAIGGGNASGLRMQAGVSVPIRPHPMTRSGVSSAYGTMPLRVGQQLWVTDVSGQEIQGVISAIDDSRIEVSSNAGRQSFARGEIRRIAVPDSLVNGTVVGAAAGGASLGAFVALIADALCDSSECDNLGPTLAGVAYGAGFGAVVGALIDSFRDRPRTVFEARSAARLNVAPTLGRHRAGARVGLSW